MFYPIVVSSLKVTEIQIVFSISSHGHKRKPKLSAELLHKQFAFPFLRERMKKLEICFEFQQPLNNNLEMSTLRKKVRPQQALLCRLGQ